jgi:hypothetical protein
MLSGHCTMTSLPSLSIKERLIRANSSSGLRLFICSLTRRAAFDCVGCVLIEFLVRGRIAGVQDLEHRTERFLDSLFIATVDGGA